MQNKVIAKQHLSWILAIISLNGIRFQICKADLLLLGKRCFHYEQHFYLEDIKIIK